MRAAASVVLAAAAAAGCDTPTSPTREIPNAIPQVAGAYTGTLTMTVTDTPGYDPMRGWADMLLTVAQDGWDVTLTATTTWPGERPNVIWDAAEGTIDRDGHWHGSERDTDEDAECGRVRYGDRVKHFIGFSFRYRLQAETQHCGVFAWMADLMRDG